MGGGQSRGQERERRTLLIMAVLAKERSSSSHWYTLAGEPAHKQPKAKGGGLRPTTLADARRMNLIPSGTTITSIMAKPSLERWKLTQVGLTAYESKPGGDESAEYYAKRIVSQSMESTDEAANFGTEVHDAIEKWFTSKEQPPEELETYVRPVISWFAEKGLKFVEAERRVVNLKEGYAGMTDLVARGKNGQAAIIDWKTRKTWPGKKVKPYDWQPEQIAAYAAAYWGEAAVEEGIVYGANVYISSTEPGRLEVSSYTPEQIRASYEVFRTVCALWRWMKKYDPRNAG